MSQFCATREHVRPVAHGSAFNSEYVRFCLIADLQYVLTYFKGIGTKAPFNGGFAFG